MKKIILLFIFLLNFVFVQNSAFSQDYDIYTVAYMTRLQNKVKSNWILPHGQPDSKTVVIFRIGRDGKVINADISQKSGDDEFDQNALAAIYKSGPFESVPQSINGDNLSINFVFNENDFEATSDSEIKSAKELPQEIYVNNSMPVLSSNVSQTVVKNKTHVKKKKKKTCKAQKHKVTKSHSGRVTPKSAGAGVLSLVVWPGLGQLVNNGPSEKAGIHAILGFLTIFRFWSFYDAVVNRQEGPV